MICCASMRDPLFKPKKNRDLRAPLGKEWQMKSLPAHLEGANGPANPRTSRLLTESVHEAIHAAAFLQYPP